MSSPDRSERILRDITMLEKLAEGVRDDDMSRWRIKWYSGLTLAIPRVMWFHVHTKDSAGTWTCHGGADGFPSAVSYAEMLREAWKLESLMIVGVWYSCRECPFAHGACVEGRIERPSMPASLSQSVSPSRNDVHIEKE